VIATPASVFAEAHSPGILRGLESIQNDKSNDTKNLKRARLMMIFRGVEYTVAESADPDFWDWQFTIAGTTQRGRTRTRLRALAIRRVELKIRAALKRFQNAADRSQRMRRESRSDREGP
jgi:hypothetical protein